MENNDLNADNVNEPLKEQTQNLTNLKESKKASGLIAYLAIVLFLIAIAVGGFFAIRSLDSANYLDTDQNQPANKANINDDAIESDLDSIIIEDIDSDFLDLNADLNQL